MKISFEGTLQEFQVLFGHQSGASAYVIEEGSSITTTPPAEVEASSEFLLKEMTQTPSLSVKETLARLPKLDDALRQRALKAFRALVHDWVKGFGKACPQPRRGALLDAFGSSPFAVPVLVMSYELLSLQRLVEQVLADDPGAGRGNFASEAEWLDFIDQIAANMVQVSHIGFPELAGTYDYSTRWRRTT